jgi:hypothetical protein
MPTDWITRLIDLKPGQVVTTVAGAERLGANAVGLQPWGDLELEGRDGQTVTVTAVPAQHGPDGRDAIQGPVIGFVLFAPGPLNGPTRSDVIQPP